VFDAVMFYQVYRPARYFFAKTDYEIDAPAFRDSLLFQWNRLTVENRYAMMNVSSSHDTPRLLTDFFNSNKYKFNTYPENQDYKTNKPDTETYQRLRLYLVHLFTSVGAPHIWNGEEMGMWGADDPHPRKPLMWKEYSFQPEPQDNYRNQVGKFDEVKFNDAWFRLYKQLIKIRNEHPALVHGELEFKKAEGKLLIYSRKLSTNEITIAINAGNVPVQIELKSGNYIDLLTQKHARGGLISLPSLEAVVLKKK
jgi:glycosidase